MGCRAAQWGEAPFIELPDIPMPRAGIGAVSIPPLLVLERVGLFPGAAQYVAEAVEQLKRRRDELIQEGSVAERLADAIGRTVPIAYGGDAIGEVAAYRDLVIQGDFASLHLAAQAGVDPRPDRVRAGLLPSHQPPAAAAPGRTSLP